MTQTMPFAIGLPLFPDMTQLDLTGPYEVFWRMPNTKVHLLWKTLEPVRSFPALAIVPDTTFDKCPSLDLICVPGGPSISTMMEDRVVHDRVVVDRNRITGAGVTSGIDFALTVAAQICGSDLAQEIQLSMEYDPAPPFVGGSPRSAPPGVVERQKGKIAPMIEKRLAVTRRVAETMR